MCACMFVCVFRSSTDRASQITPLSPQPGQALEHMAAEGRSLWTCGTCPSGQYSVDPNNPRHSCQACPLGAKCTLGQLNGVVEGSVWEKDEARGIMLLVLAHS
eukprot:2132279-Rhodomonas_salina.1